MTPEPYLTSDQGLAAFLLHNDETMLGCAPSGEEGRLFFVFVSTPLIPGLIEDWLRGNDVKRFYARVKETRRALREAGR